MKMFKTALLFIALSGSSWAGGNTLDNDDIGIYVPLDQEMHSTDVFLHYYKENNQWVMESKQGDADWQAVCESADTCELQYSDANKIREWKALLPKKLRAMPMVCINHRTPANRSFSFCRISSKPDHVGTRTYWWFLQKDGQTLPVVLKRLN